jgi:glutamate--cysteine ligase
LPLLAALPALFTGILYAPSSLDAAWDLVKNWSAADREQLRGSVPTRGLEAVIAGRKLRDIGREVLELARAGLSGRANRDAQGHDETIYLDVLDAILAGQTEAERLIGLFNGPWKGSVEPAFRECIY